LAVHLAAASPKDAELQYEAACVHDFLGREAHAVPFYLAALSGDLPHEQQRSAYLGLGSTYRALGQYAAAERTLREGLARFEDAAELKTFLAMTLHNLGRSKEGANCCLLYSLSHLPTRTFKSTVRRFCSTHKTSTGHGPMRANVQRAADPRVHCACFLRTSNAEPLMRSVRLICRAERAKRSPVGTIQHFPLY
jgi:tetratricopeptide (TPR) repeat protein